MQEMWNKIFTPEVILWVIGKTGGTEDFNTMNGFIDHVKERVDYKAVIILATQWHRYEDTKQADIAIRFAGVFHASRFMVTMDYLSKKFLAGELK